MSTGQISTGKLSTLRFSRLLAQFWEQGFSGSFRARSRRNKEILFERGWIAWAASDDTDESIRHYLLQRGILRPEQWRLAEEKAGSSRTRRMLLDLGFLTPRELQDADRERVTGIVLNIFTWRDGDYEIGPGPLPNGTPNLRIDPRDLVLEGLMSSGDRDRVLEEIGSLDAVLVVRPDDLVRASLSLPVELVDLMGKADGTRSVAEICMLSPQPDFLISAAFAALKALGLARPVEGSLAAAPPAPPMPAAGKRRSRRRGAAMAYEEGAAPETPLLPLEEGPPTMPARAGVQERPVAEAHAAPACSGSVEDGRTVPIRTPPDGLPAVPRVPEEPDAPAAEIPRAPAAAAETIRMTATDEEEFGTLPMPTPPSGTPAVSASEEGAAEAAYLETDREGEVELTPGIPVEPTPPPLDVSATGGLAPEEIEEAVGLLSEQASGAAASPLEARMDHHEEEPREPLAAGGRTSEEEPFEEELQEPGSDEISPEAGTPTWVYEPSGPPPEPERSGARWPIWTGVTAAAIVVAVAIGLTFHYSGAGDDESLTVAEISDAAEGPADVDLPETTAPETAEAPAGAETAVPDAEPPPQAGANPPGPADAPNAAPPKSPRPVALETATLAPSGPESIFQSDAFREARGLLEKGRLREAARRFDSALGARDRLYTYQLAVACEPKTVTRAIGTARGASEFFILPKTLKGRECYRLLWGRYADRAAAEKARTGIPRPFLADRNAPFPAPI